jgi:hypothetical protein
MTATAPMRVAAIQTVTGITLDDNSRVPMR